MKKEEELMMRPIPADPISALGMIQNAPDAMTRDAVIMGVLLERAKLVQEARRRRTRTGLVFAVYTLVFVGLAVLL